MLSHICLIAVGLLLIMGGFRGSAHFRPPYDALIAWCAPLGLLVTLVGIVLLVIPNFFT